MALGAKTEAVAAAKKVFTRKVGGGRRVGGRCGALLPPTPPRVPTHPLPSGCLQEVDAMVAGGRYIYTFKGGVFEVDLDELMHPGGRQVGAPPPPAAPCLPAARSAQPRCQPGRNLYLGPDQFGCLWGQVQSAR